MLSDRLGIPIEIMETSAAGLCGECGRQQKAFHGVQSAVALININGKNITGNRAHDCADIRARIFLEPVKNLRPVRAHMLILFPVNKRDFGFCFEWNNRDTHFYIGINNC